jgi:hypothetical protein
MRLFWTAWGLAFFVIAAAVATVAWLLSISETWQLVPFFLIRALCIIIGLIAFVGAFRLGLMGTVSLRVLLAQNLAIVITMELDDLRLAMQTRAIALGERPVAPDQALDAKDWQLTELQKYPALLGDRAEVRKLLGKATEHALEQILVSLHQYNDAVRDADLDRLQGAESWRSARLNLWHKIRVVQDNIAEAANTVSPFAGRTQPA